MKIVSKTALVLCLLAFGLCAVPAFAQADNQTVSNGPDYIREMPNCVNSINWELACFGDIVLVRPTDGAAGPGNCPSAFQSCYLGCVNQQQADYANCAKIGDPIAQANCYAVADTTAAGCSDDCYLQNPTATCH